VAEGVVGIEVRREGRRATLVIGDGLTRPEDRDLLGETVDQLLREGCREFVLDLENVPDIDSEGLGEVVRLCTTVSRNDGTFKLLHLTKQIREFPSISKISSWSASPWFHPREWNITMWFGFSILLLVIVLIIHAVGLRLP
jgi:anti-anti-sigma factor